MLSQILDNEYVTISFDENNKTMFVEWKENCGNLADDKHLPEFKEIRSHIEAHAPDNLIADMSACDYHLTPDSGPWFETPLFSIYFSISLKRIALIIPHNVFVTAPFDAERAYEVMGPNTELQYFANSKKAWDWLKSD